MRVFVVVAAAIAATAVSFAVATAANQPQRPVPVASKPTAVDRAILSEMKTLNRRIKSLNGAVGSPGSVLPGGLRGDVLSMKSTLDTINSSINAPLFSVRGDLHGIDGLLRDICKAVRPTPAGYPCL